MQNNFYRVMNANFIKVQGKIGKHIDACKTKKGGKHEDQHECVWDIYWHNSLNISK